MVSSIWHSGYLQYGRNGETVELNIHSKIMAITLGDEFETFDSFKCKIEK